MFHRPKADTQKVTHSNSFLDSKTSYSKEQKNEQENSNLIKEESKIMNSQHSDNNDERSVEVPGAANYQKPAGNRVPGAYPGSTSAPSFVGSSSSYSPSSPSSSTPEYASDGNRRLVVGPGITMSGEIESCDHLVVEGTIEAALKGASVLEVLETGVFYGTVEIDEATIAGRFEGDLTVNGRLTVKDTGSITGAICYKELAVESGAVLDGKIGPLKVKGGAEKKPSKAVNRTVNNQENSVSSQPSNKQNSVETGGLFGNASMEAAE